MILFFLKLLFNILYYNNNNHTSSWTLPIHMSQPLLRHPSRSLDVMRWGPLLRVVVADLNSLTPLLWKTCWLLGKQWLLETRSKQVATRNHVLFDICTNLGRVYSPFALILNFFIFFIILLKKALYKYTLKKNITKRSYNNYLKLTIKHKVQLFFKYII
jgi:hypothetical protein